jgi:ATP-dependent Lhr-like helicase
LTDLALRLALKRRLPRTWPAFFERHGNFTAVQVATIPQALDGRNVIVCAPTAGGKTEAVVAPLIELHCPPARGGDSGSGPYILYLTPTRALVNDLTARLTHPLQTLGVSLGFKTGDVSTFRPNRPPDVLLTTPESADSLLTTQARLLANLRAIVIDEIHLFDGTPRGDQLRVILNRIRRIRDYAAEHGEAPDSAIQYAALSATIAEPEAVAARYFSAAQVVSIPGARGWDVDWVGLAPDSAGDLIAYLDTFRAKGWRKALVFCNSRAEVEMYAAAVRERSPFGNAVYVHYSNIDSKRRREIEQQFARDTAALCFATTTLELGIDIGDVDLVLLIGPPGSLGSFVQRVGRANRRSRKGAGRTPVACCYRSPLEQLLFEALVGASGHIPPPPPAAFRPSVAIQQIFSLIKQSPVAAVRLTELGRLFDGMLSATDLQAIVGQLQRLQYLKVGRPGEWRAGDRLNRLLDEQGRADCSRSIYSNVQSSDPHLIDIRDQHTRQTVARVDAQFLDRPVLTVEGRALNVEWWDGEALWVTSYKGADTGQNLRYRSARQLMSYDLARLLPPRLGLAPEASPYVRALDGWWWFHWLGDLYGRAALDLTGYHIAAKETSQPGLCLYLPDEPRAWPTWTEAEVSRYLHDNYRKFESMLALGPFHDLLPTSLRRRAVVEQFDVPRFLAAVAVLEPIAAPEALTVGLANLLRES